MTDKTTTTAMAHAPASADKTLLITAIDAVITAINNAVTAAVSGNSQEWSLTVSGTPTGGTYEITVTDAVNGDQVIELDFDADSATVQAALRALTGIGFEYTVVTESGSGPNYTHTIQFKGTRADITITVDASALTGGSSPDVAENEETAYAELVKLSANSALVLKGELVNWAEDLASNLRVS